MELGIFIDNFKNQLEDSNIDITEHTPYRDLAEWDSLTTMLVIGMVMTEYNVEITTTIIDKCSTISELFEYIKSSK